MLTQMGGHAEDLPDRPERRRTGDPGAAARTSDAARPAAPPRPARAVLDAVFHVLRGGLARRPLPERFPPWRGVCDQFRRWRRAGIWQRINDVLRERTRGAAGRDPPPTAAIIDGQDERDGRRASVATTAASEATAASGTSWSVRRASSFTPACMRPTRTTAARPRTCPRASASAIPRPPACSPTWLAKACKVGSMSAAAGVSFS
jgi:transposase